jgi:hypothetical protein
MNFKTNLEDFKKHKKDIMLGVSRWSEKAACRSVGLEPFYDTEDSNLKKTAAKYCKNCPVQNQCMYTAVILKEEYGVWGGFTPRQRRSFMKKFRFYALQYGYDVTLWNDKFAAFLYHNTQIQKVEKILETKEFI